MKKLTLGQKIGLAFAWLLPALWLGMGLLLWLPGKAVLTGSYAVTFLLLPTLTLAVLYWTIRRTWHPGWRGLLCAAVLAMAVFVGFLMMFMGHYSRYEHIVGENALARYEADVRETHRLPPEVPDLGKPERTEYHRFNNNVLIFYSDCYTLICTYSPEDYAEQVAALEEQYIFHTEPLDAGDGELEPLYTLDAYEFRFLKMGTEPYHLYFPHYMVLVGTNDETKEIVWSYFVDTDLDDISDPEEFLLEDCGWKYIR